MRTAVRQVLALILCVSLAGLPVWGAPNRPLGVILQAERAHVSLAAATPGSTIFDGDTLSTEAQGTLRLRTGPAQLYLANGSAAAMRQNDAGVAATLLGGTAVFSAAGSNALEIRAFEARIRPQTDAPTVGQVTLVGPKELIVTSRRGSLEITVDEETQIVPEATSYRVVMDAAASAEPQGPRGIGARGGQQRRPRRAGRTRFVLVLLVATAVVTALAVDEVFESPDRP